LETSSIGASISRVEGIIYSIEKKIESLDKNSKIAGFQDILHAKLNIKDQSSINHYMDMPLFSPVSNFSFNPSSLANQVVGLLQGNKKDVFEIAADKIHNFQQKIVQGIGDLSQFEAINAIVDQVSADHGLDPSLAKAVIKVESNYNPDAISHAGAMGLMQLMPATAASLGVKNAYDINENINGGIKLLKSLLDSFSGDIKLTLAAYNAGGPKVREYGGIPPIPETQNYVKKVLEIYDPNIL
jgi:hypothetical protein